MPRRKKVDAQQRELDFDALLQRPLTLEDQSDIIRCCTLPDRKAPDGTGVSGKLLKSALEKLWFKFGLAGKQPIYPSYAGLAAAIGKKSKMTAIRVLHCLGPSSDEYQGLEIVGKAVRWGWGQASNIYAIDFHVLLSRHMPPLFRLAGPGSRAVGAGSRGATGGVTPRDGGRHATVPRGSRHVTQIHSESKANAQTTTTIGGQERKVVVERFSGAIRKTVLADLVADAMQRGESAGEVEQRIEQALATARLPANLGKWTKGPEAAAVVFLREGVWPTSGVVTIDQAAREAQAKADADAQKAQQAERDAQTSAARAQQLDAMRPVLAAMSDDDIRELASAEPFLEERLGKRGRDDSSVQLLLLKLLAERANER